MIHRTSITLVLAALLAASCSPSAPRAPAPAASHCVVADDAARQRITFGVIGPLRVKGARPSSDAAAAQTYETLVRVDCTGRAVPGLARTWSSGDGLHWQFDIRPGSTFTDGTPVTARSVAAALATLPMFASVAAVGEYDLRLTLRSRGDVRLFADPELAVRRTSQSGAAGTGPYEPVFDPAGGVLRLLARDGSPVAAEAGAGWTGSGRRDSVDAPPAPDTIVVEAFGADLREAIDAGVDVVVTHEDATIEYARARSGYSIAPLTWSRTYVLATTRGPGSPTSPPSNAFPDALVGAEARPAEPPFWWSGCSPAPSPGDPVAVAENRVLYQRGDQVARTIAERIAALARGRAPAWLAAHFPDGGAPAAVGAGAPELIDAVRARSTLAIVIALPRVQYGGCAAPSAELVEPLLAGWHLTPLVDTRDRLIHRTGIGHVTVDADGTIRFGRR
ncbi:MAG TPA: ABC transporter substrate-binding protein [Longimicrobiales bacterium]|nr:ABC transporter substrate-binding protein [Longimicrobiales bacterium]